MTPLAHGEEISDSNFIVVEMDEDEALQPIPWKENMSKRKDLLAFNY